MKTVKLTLNHKGKARKKGETHLTRVGKAEKKTQHFTSIRLQQNQLETPASHIPNRASVCVCVRVYCWLPLETKSFISGGTYPTNTGASIFATCGRIMIANAVRTIECNHYWYRKRRQNETLPKHDHYAHTDQMS